MSRACVVLGAGGHAKVVLETLRKEGKCKPVGLTDLRAKGKLLGVPILGDDSVLPGLRKKGTRAFVVGVGGVPDNHPRAAVFQHGLDAGLTPISTVHPSAVVSPSASVGAGTMILARALVNAGAEIGRNVIVNSAAVVEHDVRIADHAHVCPGAVVCGEARIGEGAFVGAGAVVIQGVRIGAWAVVGAGAVVVRDVPDAGRVVGAPARPLRNKTS